MHLSSLLPAMPNPDLSLIETRAERPDLDAVFQQGIVLLREVYDERMVAGFRERLQPVIHRSFQNGWGYLTHPRYPEGWTVDGDLLAMEEIRDLDYIVFHPRIVEYAKRILGPDIVYFGDSCIRLGNGGRGFHKDFQEDDDTDGPLFMVRFALYLQDHSRHSGGLKIRLESHKRMSRHVGTMMNVLTRPGDLAIFDLRTAHTGNNVQLKAYPELCLHPKLENLLPQSLMVPEEKRRICLLWTFSRPGDHLERYIEWIISLRPEHWRRSGWNERLLERAERLGVIMQKGTAEHGSQLPS